MREIIRRYGGILYIALMTAIMIGVLCWTDEMSLIYEAMRTMNPLWAAAGAGCIFGYLYLRMLTVRYYLGRRGYRIPWRLAMGITGAGQFYSAITPSASGGQPMQVYLMSQHGVPAGIGTACISVKFLGFQMSFLTMGAVLGLANWRMVNEQLYGMRWLTALGFIVNALLIVLVLLTMFRRGILDKIGGWVVRVGTKLRLVRNPEKITKRLEDEVGEYCEALKSLLRSPVDTIVVLGLSFLQTLLFMAVTVCMYYAFGLSGTSVIEILTIQVLLFIAAAFIPLPGASGAQESGFCFFFRGIFPDANLTAAMICWRFFSYYMLMIVGLIMIAVGGSKTKNKKVQKS